MNILFWASVTLGVASIALFRLGKRLPRPVPYIVALTATVAFLASSITEDWSPWFTILFVAFTAWDVALLLGSLGLLGEKWKARS